MRTKKILSLILAIAMMATISVSAAQSEVYIYEDFDYDTIEDFYKASGWLNADGTEGPYWNNSTRTTSINKAYLEGLRAAGIKRSFMYDATNARLNPLTKNYWSVAANSKGDNAYYNVANPNTLSWTEKQAFIPSKTWNGIAKADEAYVVTYDFEVVKHRFDGELVTGTYTKNSSNKYTTTPNVTSMAINYTPVSIAVENVATSAVSTVNLNNINYYASTTYTPDPSAELGTGIIEAGTYEYELKGFDVQDGFSGAYGNHHYISIGDGVVHNYTSVITKKDDTSLQRKMYADGVLYKNTATTKNLTADYSIHGVVIETGSWASLKYSNVKAYTLKTTAGAFNASTAAAVVPASTTNVKVKFSQPVNAVTYDKTAVTMTANEEPLTYGVDFAVSDITEIVGNEGGEIYSEATVTFMTELAEDTDYVITFPGTIENTISTKLDGYNTVSFSTPKPEIAINSFDVVSGFASDAEAVAAGFVANGTLQGAKLNLTNTTDAAKNVAVIYAVYASNGQLKDIVYINDSIEADTTAAFHTGVKLSETGSVKAFIWDGLTSVKPYRDATVKTIAAE